MASYVSFLSSNVHCATVSRAHFCIGDTMVFFCSVSIDRKASAFAGALEVIASETVVYRKSYATTDGPTCVFCERRVCALDKATPPICKSCSQARITLSYHPHGQEEINAVYNALTAGVEPRESCNQTLVFLTARKSGKSDSLDLGVFEAVWRSVQQSEKYILVTVFRWVHMHVYTLRFVYYGLFQQQSRCFWQNEPARFSYAHEIGGQVC